MEVFTSFSFDHVLAVTDRLLQTNDDFILLNVYVPCDMRSQQMLWESLSNRLAPYADSNICVCGDFIVVRGRKKGGVWFRLLGCLVLVTSIILLILIL